MDEMSECPFCGWIDWEHALGCPYEVFPDMSEDEILMILDEEEGDPG